MKFTTDSLLNCTLPRCFFDKFFPLLIDSTDLYIKTSMLDLLCHLISCFDKYQKQLLPYFSISQLVHLNNSAIIDANVQITEDRIRLFEKVKNAILTAKNDDHKHKLELQSSFTSKLIQQFYGILDTISISEENIPPGAQKYCEKFLELMIDIQSQFLTRRYFNIVFNDHLFIPTCKQSMFLKNLENFQTNELLNILKFYATFEIDDVTGAALTSDQMMHARHEKISEIQKKCFVSHPTEFEDFIFCAPSALNTPKDIKEMFGKLSDELILTFCEIAGIRSTSVSSGKKYSRDFLVECITWLFQKHSSQLELIKREPLYPTESLIFNQHLAPSNGQFSNRATLAIPKLNLHFLTFHDYLIRNFRLYKLESAFSIRQDIVDAILRLAPRYNLDSSSQLDQTVFTGWSRNAIQLHQLQIEKTGSMKLDENISSYIQADLCYDISKYSRKIQDEWDDLKVNDTLFLVSVVSDPELTLDPSAFDNDRNTFMLNDGKEFMKKYGIKHIRGCQVFELFDDEGNTIHDFNQAKIPDKDGESKLDSGTRTIRVLFDPNQFEIDTLGI